MRFRTEKPRKLPYELWYYQKEEPVLIRDLDYPYRLYALTGVMHEMTWREFEWMEDAVYAAAFTVMDMQ